MLTDFAVWRPSTGTWHVTYSSAGQHVSQHWDAAGDVPIFGSPYAPA